MSTLQLLIVCITVLALALTLRQTVARPRRGGLADAKLLDREVVVYLGDSQSVRGHVRDVNPATLVLAGATLVSASGQTPMAGSLDVPTDSIVLIQELPPNANSKSAHDGLVRA